MRHGKDVMLDKPGATTLEQLAELRRVQAETGRILSILYSEHYTQPCDRRRRRTGQARRDRPRAADDRPRAAQDRQLRAARLVLEPRADRRHPLRHRLAPGRAVPVLHRRERGGGRRRARSRISITPKAPEFEDFGQMLLVSDAATGFIRVDWFTQDGLPVWGDGRLFILGTEGTIELRKYIDIAGRPGGDHLFIVDRKGVRHVDCAGTKIIYGEQLRDDVLNRTETAMKQSHCFYATELALIGAGARRHGSAASGRAERARMSAPLKVGVVGAGVGANHVGGVRRAFADLYLVEALCDIDRGARQGVATEIGGAKAVTSL